MFRLVVVLACVAAAIAATKSLNERIVGGSAASPDQFPYQVSVRTSITGKHVCGGTIINSRFIITSAQCIYNQLAGNFIVVVGTNKLSTGGTTYILEKVVYHGSYNPLTSINDIAILKTSQDIVFSTTVKALPLQQDEVPTGTVLTLSGWGLTSYLGVTPDTLQFIALSSIDINECRITLVPNPVFDSEICTYNRIGQGACAGDSGGPLVYGGNLVGVVSRGRLCALGFPDVFTKVSSYVSWIQTKIQTL